MQVDYIIVGCGLAGISFSEQLEAHNKSFVVFDNASQQSSTVAGGMYNPVVLKRFTSVWKNKEQLQIAIPFYNKLENLLGVKLDFKLPVLRKFNSTEEQNNWFAASDKPNLNEFLSLKIITNTNSNVNAEFGMGEVLHTGRIDTAKLIEFYKSRLNSKGQLKEEAFDYNSLQFQDNSISYKNFTTKHIVFAEGFGLKHNPFFNNLPLKGTKGELITIHAPDLKIDCILKSGVFLIPLGVDIYRVGATYEWEDKTNTPTQKGRKELLYKLRTLINCDFEVIDQVAGIRPTVIDRRPLVGRHKDYKNLFILNGLGTRGVMIAPYVSKQLFGLIEKNKELEKEVDVSRFY